MSTMSVNDLLRKRPKTFAGTACGLPLVRECHKKREGEKGEGGRGGDKLVAYGRHTWLTREMKSIKC